jgi:FtsP/CotA-like multicopper oxidase with cupredoxin domain
MGPTMRVKPGQTLWIKLINNMTESIGPNEVSASDYWRMLQNPGENIKYQYYKRPVSDPSLMKVDVPNIPKRFDTTNLHLHGLDVDVHMFDPVGKVTDNKMCIYYGRCW